MAACLGPAVIGAANAPADEPRDLSQPIRTGVSDVFYPYSFRDDDGALKGFAVDIADAVARAMQLRLERTSLDNFTLGDALRRGDLDMLQFWGETPARLEWAAFSVPIVTFETVVVVRADDTRIRSLDDLAGRVVAIGQPGTVGARYMRENHPTATLAEDATTEDYLRKVSSGAYDAAVLSRITAVSTIDRRKLKNLRVLDARIPGNDYDVRYCFAVRKQDAVLLRRLNEGLAIIHRSGEFDRIYSTWFGRFEARRFTPFEVMSYVATALALALMAASWGFLRQRTLSRRIRQQANELSEQRSLLAALHEKHPLATVVFAVAPDQPPRLVSINPEAARLLAIDPATAAATPLDSLALSADLAEHIQNALGRAAARDTPMTWEHRLPTTLQVLESTVLPLGELEQGGHRVCLLLADITHRRLAEEELAQARRLRALGELVGGIAHEFNNLLTPIIGTTAVLRAERQHDTVLHGDLGLIDQAARRAAELTKRLLTFGRKNDDAQSVVHLGDAVKNCFAMLQPTVDRRVEWHAEIPADLPPVVINPVDLHQVLFNLVINARDTLLARLGRDHPASWVPRVSVTALALPAPAHRPRRPKPDRVIEGWIRVTVADNGEGMSEDVRERIFEPFFTTKDVGKGTGLGLATVWHSVIEAGGDVTVDSKPQEGSRFHVFLPHASVVSRTPAEPAAVPVPAPVHVAEAGRILLAEDEPMVARTTTVLLRKLGFDAVHVPDGQAAWERLERNSREFDALLLDVNMPRLSGVDLVRRVRTLGYGGRIIMTSGRVAEEEIAALRALGVDYILPKPFLFEDLQAALASRRGGPAVS